MYKEIETAVAELVAQACVTFSAIYAGETKNAFGEAGHTMDKWSCAFTKGDGREAHEEFEYFTGLGHRAEPTKTDKIMAGRGLPALTEKDITQRTIYGRRYFAALEKMRKPQAPHVAGVLHSLILDSSATGQSFADWCSDFGYDTDSRKAHATYEACQQNADKLARIFTHAQREALQTALQDY